MAKKKNRKGREKSLRQRQREYVFTKQASFAPVTRNQIFGADYLLEQVDPYVRLLRDFDLGGGENKSFFKCVMFAGAPGTGKTYLARYIATTAGGSGEGLRFVDAREFPRDEPKESWTQRDVKRLWGFLRAYVAEERKPIILFWDQFDGFVQDEDGESALEQLYVEIDGLGGRPNGILFVAATTAEPLEDFDDQLMRPGRFSPGDVVEFHNPTRKGKGQLLSFYFGKKPHADFDVNVLSYLTHDDTTPADICGLIDDAFERARLRVQGSEETAQIEKSDLVKVLVMYLAGKPDAAAGELTDDKVLSTCIHELGHTLIARILGWPIMLICVIPHGDEFGQTFIDYGIPEDDWTFDNARDAIAESYGGLVAGKIADCPEDFGTHRDYLAATAIARKLVMQLGGGGRMREAYGHINVEDWNQSEEMKTAVENDVGRILKEEEKRAEEILRKVGREKIMDLARVLAKERVILGEEFEKLLLESGTEVRPVRKF